MNLSDVALAWIRQAYLVALVASLVFMVLAEADPPGIGLRQRLRHGLRNVLMFALVVLIADALVLGLLLRIPFRLTESSGLLSFFPLPPLAVFAIGFVVFDLLEYLFHRLSHHLPWLWRLHAVHHSDSLLDATSALRSHPLEVTLSVLLKVAVGAVLGIPPWVEGARAVLANPWAMLQHARLPGLDGLDRRCRHWLATPAVHRVHHSTDARDLHANYGVIFSVWDRLFGTYRPPERVINRNHGLPGLEDESWQTVWGMLATPFRAGPLAIPRPRADAG